MSPVYAARNHKLWNIYLDAPVWDINVMLMTFLFLMTGPKIVFSFGLTTSSMCVDTKGRRTDYVGLESGNTVVIC